MPAADVKTSSESPSTQPDGPPDSGDLHGIRQWVARRLSGSDSRLVQVTQLVCSELVTNAIVHGRGVCGVRLQVSPGLGTGTTVRVEVDDHVTTRPVVCGPDPDRPAGRGMVLVSELSDRWGVRSRATGKTVWCLVVSVPPVPGAA